MIIMEETTLLFRHLPAELSNDERKDLLFHFGASRVRLMGSKGAMKNTAFAVFPSKDHANEVLHQLHQTVVLGSKLIVEFAVSSSDTSLIQNGEQKRLDGQDKELEDKLLHGKGNNDTEKREIKFDTQFATWGVKHSRRPELKYYYPSPNPTVLANIMNALASVPRFYVQVLHLMNKMDLPAPFTTVTAAPPMVFSQPDDVRQREMDISTSDETESEMESDGESKTDRTRDKELLGYSHRKTVRRPASKKPRLSEFQQETVISQTPSAAVTQVKDVFEQMPDSSQVPKRIALNISGSSFLSSKDTAPSQREREQLPWSKSHYQSADAQKKSSTKPSTSTSFPTTIIHSAPLGQRGEVIYGESSSVSQQQQQNHPHHHQIHPTPHDPSPGRNERRVHDVHRKEEDRLTNPPELSSSGKIDDGDDETTTRPGGFGIISNATKVQDASGEVADRKDSSVQEFGKRKFISSSALRRGRLSEEEMKDSSVFRRYDPGEVSCRLYIKNVARQTTEEDLHFIYGRYVDWDSETEINMFDIRLMKEGRMKGQAFVTLPSEEVTKDALGDSNGFVLNDKPLVVQFARSAKAQEDAATVRS